MTLGSVRHQIRINRSADDVWKLAGDPARLHEWFPGLVSSDVEGTSRTIVAASGVAMPEEILVNDHVTRRFQYRLTPPIFKFHRGTIDALDVGDGTCIVVYSTEADPRAMAVTIAGATAAALDELKRQMELPAPPNGCH
jgi:hypothetical protein